MQFGISQPAPTAVKRHPRTMLMPHPSRNSDGLSPVLPPTRIRAVFLTIRPVGRSVLVRLRICPIQNIDRGGDVCGDFHVIKGLCPTSIRIMPYGVMARRVAAGCALATCAIFCTSAFACYNAATIYSGNGHCPTSLYRLSSPRLSSSARYSSKVWKTTCPSNGFVRVRDVTNSWNAASSD